MQRREFIGWLRRAARSWPRAPAAHQACGVAIIRNPARGTASVLLMGAIEALAPSLGFQLTTVDVPGVADIERAFDALARDSIGGLIAMPDPITLVHRDRIIDLAAEHK